MDIADLPLVGGHPALDLVNTLERGTPVPGTAPRDYLMTADDAQVWVARVDLISKDDLPGVGAASLLRLRELREAIYQIVRAGLATEGEPEAGDGGGALAVLNRFRSSAAARSRLRAGRAGGPLLVDVGTDPAHRIEDRLADAAFALLTGPDSARIRRCPIENGGCGWVFVDRSRNGSRTWCRMSDCGNQVKARRLTEKRRQARKER